MDDEIHSVKCLTPIDMKINEVFCDYLSSTDNQQQPTVMIFLQGRVFLKV